MNYTEYKNKWLGKLIDYDAAYGGQCFDVLNQYILEMTGKRPHIRLAAAAQVWERPGDVFPDVNDWEQIANTPDFVPQQGDVVVWGRAPWNGQYGHVGIIDSSDLNQGLVLQQNGFNPSEGVRLINWNWHTHNFIGVFRLRNQVSNPQPQPTVVQLTAQAGDGISHLFRRAGRQDFGDSNVWWEFGHLNNGADRVFAGQVYNISTLRLERPQPAAPAPTQPVMQDITVPEAIINTPVEFTRQLHEVTQEAEKTEGTWYLYDTPQKESFDIQKFLVGMSKNGQLYSLLTAIVAAILQWLKVQYPEYAAALDAATIIFGIGGTSATISNGTHNALKK